MWRQEMNLSTNDISRDGVQRIREILAGLVTASGCVVNLEDNDDDDEDTSNSDSDISDVGDMPVITDGGGDGSGRSGGGGGSAGASSPLAAAVGGSGAGGVGGAGSGSVSTSEPAAEKVLDVRGPRGALDAEKAASLCAPILRYARTCCVRGRGRRG
jgi:hypothetical protein